MDTIKTSATSTKRAEKLTALTADIKEKGIALPIDWLTVGKKVTPLTRDVFYVITVNNGQPTVNESGEDITGYTKYMKGMHSIINAVRMNSYQHAADAFKLIADAVKIVNTDNYPFALTFTKEDFAVLSQILVTAYTAKNPDNKNDITTEAGIKAGATTKNNFERWLFVRMRDKGDYSITFGRVDALNEKSVNTKDYKKMLKSYGELVFKGEKKQQAALDKKAKIQEAGKKLGYTAEKIAVDLQNAIEDYKTAHQPAAPVQPESTVTVPDEVSSLNDKKAETTVA